MHIQRFAIRLRRFAALAALCSTAGCSSDSKAEDNNDIEPNNPGGSGSYADGGTGGANAGGASAGGSTNGNNCEEHVVSATLATPDMLVVLDRSGSMNPDSNDDRADRWGGSRDAVVQVTSDFDD